MSSCRTRAASNWWISLVCLWVCSVFVVLRMLIGFPGECFTAKKLLSPDGEPLCLAVGNMTVLVASRKLGLPLCWTETC